jgi:signal transduction histidine kinase
LHESEERYRTLAGALNTQIQFRTQELERRNLELRDLSHRLLQSQDEERRHIARELHDSAGQTLVSLSMHLARIGKDLKNNPALLAKEVQVAEDLVRELTQEIRTTSYLLHPPLLDEIGISSALNWYVEGLAERSGLKIDLQVPDNLERLPAEMELLIFRLVQECITNIHRHSGSKTALIRIELEGTNIQVKVEDQGAGMTPERLAEIQAQGKGVGIRGMRERVGHFCGDLIIESSSSGTRVCATLPLNARPSKDHSSSQQGAKV